MKKVFFTAIAMVAFSAVSFANTIEVKVEVVPVEKKSTNTVKVEDDKRTCQEIMVDVYETIMDGYCGEIGSGCGGNSNSLLNYLMSAC